MQPETANRLGAPFTEKGFYLGEFRGRTLALAARSQELADPLACESVLKELEANHTGVVVISADSEAMARLLTEPLRAVEEDRLEGSVWRALQRAPRIGVRIDAARDFTSVCRDIAVRLRVAKLVWLDSGGGLLRPDGGRRSFVDLQELGVLLRSDAYAERAALLREIEAALRGGLASVSLCTPQGLADELFTYAGSGTLFTRERYVDVRDLGLDDFSAAFDLIARGVAEGYLAPRSDAEIDRVFANGVGAFVEGCHLAGIGALLPHAESNMGEVASLYTLTRFLGEGVGGHLVTALVERARGLGYASIFACTTSEQVAGFFERQGFRRVPREQIPDAKWRNYDAQRREQVTCVLHDLQPAARP
ncbi:MAG: GNAT family N-acetyltransferase [Myxococcales bacterium]|nr:GNAT family N-acetyltransferase [Myxococcales bacterium]